MRFNPYWEDIMIKERKELSDFSHEEQRGILSMMRALGLEADPKPEMLPVFYNRVCKDGNLALDVIQRILEKGEPIIEIKMMSLDVTNVGLMMNVCSEKRDRADIVGLGGKESTGTSSAYPAEEGNLKELIAEWVVSYSKKNYSAQSPAV